MISFFLKRTIPKLLFSIAGLSAFVFAATAPAPPLIFYRQVVSSASYAPSDLPSGAIARGSFFSIFGSNLGPATPLQAHTYPLQTTFAGVSIIVVQGQTSIAAIPWYVSPTQINAIMPSQAPLGQVSVQVTYNNQTSNYATTTVSASTFGIFSVNGGGLGPGVVQNFVAQDQQPVNSLKTAAKPGDTLILWGTGLGAVPDDTVAPSAVNTATPVEVFIGGVAAKVLYAGRSSCCSGLDEIVVKSSANTPLGCWVPVQVRTNGTTISNTVTMAVSADRSACSEPKNPEAAAYITGGNVAVASVNRHAIYNDIDFETTSQATNDSGLISVGKEPGGAFEYNAAVSLPPIGSCATFMQRGGVRESSSLGFAAAALPAAGTLDAGPAVTVQVGSFQDQLPNALSLPYGGILGDSLATPSTTPLTPGTTASISAPGGADVGAFQTSVQAAAPLSWSNQNSIRIVNRSNDLPITWTGQNGTALIVAMNYDIPTDSSATVLCRADAASGSFTIPSYALSALPVSRAGALRSAAWVMLGFTGDPATFTGSNLKAGFARSTAWSDKKVLFQ